MSITQKDIISMALKAGAYDPDNSDDYAFSVKDLYRFADFIATAEHEWVGLTDEEISEVLGSDIHLEQSGELKFIRAIEAKLREKNT